MFKLIMNSLNAQTLPLYKKTVSVDPHSGGDIVDYRHVKDIVCCLQSADGVVLDNTPAGDAIAADFILYSEEKPEEHDRVSYLDYNLEVRRVEPYGLKGMSHFKSYLVNCRRNTI